MNDTGSFIRQSTRFLRDDFLPRIRVAVETLTDEQVWWRPNEASNSIGNLMLHLSGNVSQWIVGGVGAQRVMRDRPREFAVRATIPKHELLATLASSVDEAVKVLDHIDPMTLNERRTIQGSDVTVLYAIYHVVEHFSMHTGQILMLAKMITGEDLKLYEFPDGIVKKRW